MSLHAFNSGCNAVCFNKKGQNFGMCCAWAQMIDYDKLTMLLGGQSITGKNIEKGDIIGVSALAKGQEKIALTLGDNHSNEVNKFENIEFSLDGSAILIPGAKTQMTCKVIDVMHLDCCKEDNFIVLEVIKAIDNEKDETFLTMKDLGM